MKPVMRAQGIFPHKRFRAFAALVGAMARRCLTSAGSSIFCIGHLLQMLALYVAPQVTGELGSEGAAVALVGPAPVVAPHVVGQGALVLARVRALCAAQVGRLVGRLVQLQLPLGRAGKGALAAASRPLSAVHRSLMGPQVAEHSGLVRALAARVRPFTRVGANVALQVTAAAESRRTLGAQERRVPRVRAQVHQKLALVAGREGTQLATEWLFITMHSLVHLEGPSVPSCIVTLITVERLFPRMPP